MRALLFVPKTTVPDQTTPAVVMLHGSAGMIDDRAKYGPQLASIGIAALLVETYDSRRDLGTGFVEQVLNITETMFVADGYAAREIEPRLRQILVTRVRTAKQLALTIRCRA